MNIDKIITALIDPKAPWYGSEIVVWVGDLIEEYEKLQAENADLKADLDAECRVSQMLLDFQKKLDKRIKELETQLPDGTGK